MNPARPMCVHCKRKNVTRPRGLCYGCFRKPAIRVTHPTSNSKFARPRDTPEDLARHSAAADLELLATMLAAPSSGMSYEEWTKVLGQFTPRMRRVVVLHGLMGMTFYTIGERLGVSGTRCDQIWRKALPKLTGLAGSLRKATGPAREDDRRQGRVRTPRAVAM